MRRKIELYIDGAKADLEDRGLILYNYALTDLQKPTAVKNSYSRQIALPGTDANDAIFGHIYRADRIVGASGFNPMLRTPFVIMDETSEILQSGYLKLDRVERKGDVHTYTVTLYGGIGQLIYGLTYGSDGEKLDLSDLVFDVNDADFYFVADKDSVAKAWARLYDGSNEPIWDIVNFAPCYNGLPDTLESGKARIQGDYGNVVTLSRKYCEWETRDLRGYLQRPCVKVEKILDGIVDMAAAIGKTVVLDPAFFAAGNDYYKKTWMLLPMLTSYQNDAAGQIGEPSTPVAEMNDQVLNEIPTGANVKVTGNTFSSDASGDIDFSGFDPSFFVAGDVTVRLGITNSLYGLRYLNYWDGVEWKGTLVGVQAFMVDSGNNVLAETKVAVFGTGVPNDPRLISLLSYLGASEYFWAGNEAGPYSFGDGLQFNNVPVSADSAVRLVLSICAVKSSGSAGDDLFPLYGDEQDSTSDNGQLFVEVTGGRLTLNSPGTVGSGTVVTKEMLLSGTSTPADFLLSYCRQFGLHIVETGPDEISILARNTFYNGGVADLASRLDRRDTKLAPLVFDKKWQRFALPVPETQAAKAYVQRNGRPYGDINLDTGMDFNAETEDLLAGSVFKGGISGKWASGRLYDFTKNGNFVNPCLIAGYDDEGTMVYPPYDTATPVNSDNPGYDFTEKVFGFDMDNGEQKAVDISGTLVFFNGIVRNPGMWFLSNNVPSSGGSNEVCWQLVTSNDTYSTKIVNLPEFSRYTRDAGGNVLLSLDFGTPQEVFDPAITLTPSSSIYTRFWEAFAVDRYDASNKILTAKVDLSGLKVGPELLRRFWLYEGSLWIINKINNHSLTTWDLTECEFIQVRGKVNYTNGQTL